ncbi:MAG: hypothetical protein L3K17_00600 [Thermoplasmata archaeon]|nr:hypothetical protein [Thermoplasmata archaeon]
MAAGTLPDKVEKPGPPPPRKNRLSRRDRRIALAAVVIAVIVGAAVVVVRQEQATTSSGGASAAPTVLAAAGTKWSLPAGYYEEISFDLRIAATVTGGLFASQAAVVLILNQSEFQTFNTTGNSTSHVYSSGSLQTVKLDLTLSAGSWYLVISNQNATTTTEVTVTSTILATASG